MADRELRCDRSRGRQDMAEVGPMLLVVRSRHGDDEDVGGGDLGRGDKRAARYHALDQPVEIDFLDMHLAVVDGVDDMLADVNARDLVARASDALGGGQADIPAAAAGDVLCAITKHKNGSGT